MSALKFVVLGAGGRGRTFSEWVENEIGPGAVVAVAEPDPIRRNIVAEAHGIPSEKCFNSWQELLAQPKMADVVINTTMDQEHVGSAVMAMEAGYDMMLEKPMAITLKDCQKIDAVRQKTNRIVSICHSLRYNASFSAIREIIRSGVLGEIVSYDQLEAVENIHMSHSFVRGNWGRERDATFMLMAKSCHDIDIIIDMMGQEVSSVSSYGNLSYFKPENAPEGAPKFCIEGCPHSASCPYEATKIYLSETGWGRYAGFDRMERQQAMDALRVSNYGKCVFHAGNDVVDHQVVSMQFKNKATATFTMTGFTPFGGRFVRVHGTKGYLESATDDLKISYWEFWKNNQKTDLEVKPSVGTHGGGDAEVMRALVKAIEERDPSYIKTDTATSLRTHTVVFMAERSRREGRSISIETVKSPMN